MSAPVSAKSLFDSCLLQIAEGITPAEPRVEQETHGFEFSDLLIRTKKRQTTQFTPNPVQVGYLRSLDRGWSGGVPKIRGLRSLILKARQQGFSTLIEALFFLDTISTPNTNTLVIAHDRESTQKIFRMVQYFYKHLPHDLRPQTQYANRYEYYWPKLNSSFFVGTAGSSHGGRGGTINNLHGTEVAFWSNPEDILAGLMEAVPEDGNVVLESTANGVGTWHHELWLEAEEGRGNYQAFFSPWFAHDEYVREVPSGFKLTESEAELKERHALSDEQVAWHRWKSNDLKRKMPQEHPSTPEEAFLSSGNPYFNRPLLQSRIDYLRANPPETHAVPEGLVRLRALQPGEIVIFAPPEQGKAYAIGADPAEGLNAKGTDHDYCSADVFDASSGDQVASLHGRWSPREFGLILAELGFWYGTALMAIERNNHGHAVLDAALYEAGYPQQTETAGTGMYMHQEFDANKIPTTRRPGYPTTPKTKALADDDLAAAIENLEIFIYSIGALQELMRYVKLPGGKAGGDGGTHDDRVRSIALAQQMMKLRPRGWTHSKQAMDFLMSRVRSENS